MKVKELIEKLNNMPLESEILIYDHENDFTWELDKIWKEFELGDIPRIYIDLGLEVN